MRAIISKPFLNFTFSFHKFHSLCNLFFNSIFKYIVFLQFIDGEEVFHLQIKKKILILVKHLFTYFVITEENRVQPSKLSSNLVSLRKIS